MSDLYQPVSPGEGPLGAPTPVLPSSPASRPPAPPRPSAPNRPSTPNYPIAPPGSDVGVTVYRCPEGYTAGFVEQGQSFANLLLRHNVSYNAMRAANPGLSTGTPAPGTFYCAPPEGSRKSCAYGSRTYVLGQGETFNSVLRRLNTTAAALLRANPDLAPGDFLPGRVICAP